MVIDAHRYIKVFIIKTFNQLLRSSSVTLNTREKFLQKKADTINISCKIL